MKNCSDLGSSQDYLVTFLIINLDCHTWIQAIYFKVFMQHLGRSKLLKPFKCNLEIKFSWLPVHWFDSGVCFTWRVFCFFKIKSFVLPKDCFLSATICTCSLSLFTAKEFGNSLQRNTSSKITHTFIRAFHVLISFGYLTKTLKF